MQNRDSIHGSPLTVSHLCSSALNPVVNVPVESTYNRCHMRKLLHFRLLEIFHSPQMLIFASHGPLGRSLVAIQSGLLKKRTRSPGACWLYFYFQRSSTSQAPTFLRVINFSFDVNLSANPRCGFKHLKTLVNQPPIP